MSIDQVGVIGAGQMGNGIAHVCALAGYSVVMLDAKAEALTAAVATVTKNMERQVGRKLIGAEDRDPALARIATAPTTPRSASATSRRRPSARKSSTRSSRR